MTNKNTEIWCCIFTQQSNYHAYVTAELELRGREMLLKLQQLERT
jgi:hypothetical protein